MLKKIYLNYKKNNQNLPLLFYSIPFECFKTILTSMCTQSEVFSPYWVV